MEFLAHITIGELILAFLICCLLHEALVAILPDDVAGPGGWLIDTGSAD